MAVITLASSKGGCGKSTAAIVLAGAFAEQGMKVCIIDADPRARVKRWAEEGSPGPNITVQQADSQNIRAVIEKANDTAQIVIIDVEGSGNYVVPQAIGRSNLVIVPANQSASDVEDAVATVKLVQDTFTANGKHPPYALLWSRASFAFKSQEIAALEDQIASVGIPVIGRLHDRTAYKSIFSFCTTLDQLPAKSTPKISVAREEAEALAMATTKFILENHEVTA